MADSEKVTFGASSHIIIVLFWQVIWCMMQERFNDFKLSNEFLQRGCLKGILAVQLWEMAAAPSRGFEYDWIDMQQSFLVSL